MIEVTSDLQLVDEVTMKLKVVIHRCKYPPIPGCATQGESFEESLTNLYEAVEGCLSVKTTR